MKKNFFRDLSASTFQVLLNQALALVIFFLISSHLDKSVYGELSWSMAVLTFTSAMLSLRLEQVIVKKVAAGEDPSKMLSLFSAHIFLAGFIFYMLLLGAHVVFPSFFDRHNLFLMLAIPHLLTFFTTPFKQLANGSEKFHYLAIMSSVANMVRTISLVSVLLVSELTVWHVLMIFFISALAELAVCLYVVTRVMGIRFNTRLRSGSYFNLVRESAPQIGAAFLNAGITRIDLILLGFITGTVVTAEYGFASRMTELLPIPMMILAPILLSRFTKYFKTRSEGDLKRNEGEMLLLVRVQLILATLFPLILNLCWAPLIDALTGNKYGAVNSLTFFILSLAIPFQYMISLLWTMHFTQNRLRFIFKTTAISFLVALLGNLALVPLLKAQGAAIIFVLAMAVQCTLLFRRSVLSEINGVVKTISCCMLTGVIATITVYFIPAPLVIKLILGLGIYGYALYRLGIIRVADLRTIRVILRPSTGNAEPAGEIFADITDLVPAAPVSPPVAVAKLPAVKRKTSRKKINGNEAVQPAEVDAGHSTGKERVAKTKKAPTRTGPPKPTRSKPKEVKAQ